MPNRDAMFTPKVKVNNSYGVLLSSFFGSSRKIVGLKNKLIIEKRASLS